MTLKLVYKLYIAHLISCVNFIGINQVVFEYGLLKVSNLLTSRIIIMRVKVKQLLTKQIEKQC